MSTWKLDSAHSRLGFKVKHLMVSTAVGEFKKFDATIESNSDSFENATVSFTGDATSISTNNEQRDGHLKSPDFLDVEKHPTITFTSTSFKKTGDATFEVTGDFTMKSVTKQITFNATLTGLGKAMDGAPLAGFELTGSINRMDFGATWNAALETGGVVVSEMVAFDANLEFKMV